MNRKDVEISVASMVPEVEVPRKVDEKKKEADLTPDLGEQKGTTLRDLPDELFSAIFAQLPVHNLIQLKSICKAWNSLLNDSVFLEKCLQLRRNSVSFYVWQADDGYAAYNPESSSWHRWSRSFIRANGWVAAAVNGLLLLESHEGDERSLHLANPVNKTEKKLTLASTIHDPLLSFIIGMVKDTKSESYKILAMSRGISDEMFLYDYQGRTREENDEDEDEDDEKNGGQNYKIYTYDSKVNTWEFTCALERGEQRYFNCPVFHNGSVYCLLSGMDFHYSGEHSRLVRLERGSYREMPAVTPSVSHLTFLHLFERQGHLMLAGGRSDKEELHSVQVWQLDEEKKVWAELMTMPIELVRCLSIRVELDVFSGYYVCASAHMLSVTSVSTSHLVSVVMCDLTRGFWWQLPRPPYSIRPSRRPRTFLFYPKFDVFL